MSFVNEDFKFEGMRKPQEFTLYPCKEGEPVILLQSDRRMVKVEIATGKALMSKDCNYPTAWHCQRSAGAKLVTLSIDDMLKIKSMVQKMAPQVNEDGSVLIVG